jgi:hypothetical protein
MLRERERERVSEREMGGGGGREGKKTSKAVVEPANIKKLHGYQVTIQFPS